MNGTIKACAVAAAIFLLGAGAGSLATTYFGVRSIRQELQSAGEGPSLAERGLGTFRSDLVSQVAPDAAQLKLIDEELGKVAAELRVQRREFVRDIVRELWVGNRRIREHLDPERRQKFDTLMRARLGRFGLAPLEPATPAK